MSADRGLNVLTDLDQWSRCRHTGTAVFAGPGISGGIQLTWSDPNPTPAPASASAAPGVRAGAGFSAGSHRGYSAPITTVSASQESGALAFDQFGNAYVNRGTDTAHVWRHRSPTIAEPFPAADNGRPVALAVDADQRLYAAHDSSSRIVIVDVYTQKRIGAVEVGPGRPLDVAVVGDDVAVLVEEPVGIVWVRSGRRTTVTAPRCPEGLRPVRVAGDLLVLWRHPDTQDSVICRADGTVVLEHTGVTDFAQTPDGALVVAAAPGQPFRRFVRGREVEPVRADTYDGGAIAVSFDGAVGFSTATGVGWTAGSAADYAISGNVVSYRLDSGRYRNRWGRIFLDACLPVGTTVEVAGLTSDQDDVVQPLDPAPPDRGGIDGHPVPSPPLPAAALWNEVTWQTLYQNGIQTYEAPVAQPPGRYLWIGLRLGGTGAVTPRVREVRVERTGHRLLDYLPRNWSRDPVAAGFLYRFLTPAEGLLHDVGERAALRSALLDPAATPAATLPWLASLVGLALDDSWPEAARRTLVAEAYPLFARRGTLAALTRLLEIYLGYPPALVERWRIPGAVADDAHRFIVYLRGGLDDQRRRVLAGILDAHAPAHTRWEIRDLGPGPGVQKDMRAGVNTVALAGALGTPFVVGDSVLGVDGLLGGGPS